LTILLTFIDYIFGIKFYFLLKSIFYN